MINLTARFTLCLLACATLICAADLTGTVTDPGANRSVEFVAVTLKKTDGTVVQSTVTDGRGRFTLEKVPAGDYVVAKNGAEEATFKKYRVRGQDEKGRTIFELIPLNDDYETMRSDQQPIQGLSGLLLLLSTRK